MTNTVIASIQEHGDGIKIKSNRQVAKVEHKRAMKSSILTATVLAFLERSALDVF